MIDDKTEIFLRIHDGRAFVLVDVNHLRPEHIEIEGIAAALSKLCRFGGNLDRHYSVAQHSVIVANLLGNYSADIALWGLMHDAAEAFVIDLPSPIKRHMTDYQILEQRVMMSIASRFGLAWPPPWQVRKADQLIGMLEQVCLQGISDPARYVETYGRIEPVGALEAEIMFLEKYLELVKQIPAPCKR